ncbi:hypothetical protein [Alteribacter natronophilus]|uniref:hypothetical protein n=1 Tax=Alteribacter natronophilus TaxID=2583810 RepID=UPI00110E849B|nr:hypothetical protein [Alteribacter natronophilus]TMW71013.1 hypothetical protein FGB90_13650 [Alteribacter natronophilus]
MSKWNEQAGHNLNTDAREAMNSAAMEDEKIEADVKKQNGLGAHEAAGREIPVRAERRKDTDGPR